MGSSCTAHLPGTNQAQRLSLRGKIVKQIHCPPEVVRSQVEVTVSRSSGERSKQFKQTPNSTKQPTIMRKGFLNGPAKPQTKKETKNKTLQRMSQWSRRSKQSRNQGQ